MAAPLLEAIEIQVKDITADARLTQRAFATYRVEDRQAHDHFTIKGNPPTLLEEVTLHFARRQEPDFVEGPELEHGRIETSKLWTRAALNDDLNFPHVGQVFLVERERLDKKTGQHATELAYGITSRPPEQADAQRLLNINRGHWSIELVIKRLKSILNIDYLRARQGGVLADLYLHGKRLYAWVLEKWARQRGGEDWNRLDRPRRRQLQTLPDRVNRLIAFCQANGLSNR